MSRMKITRDWLVSCPDTNRFQSPKRSASAALRRKLGTGTPAVPLYCVDLVVPVAEEASCSCTLVSTTAYPPKFPFVPSPKYTPVYLGSMWSAWSPVGG